MKREVLLAVLMKKMEEKLEASPTSSARRGPRGFPGVAGSDGKDFKISEHAETLKSWAKEFALKFEDFTEEQLELLRGPRGHDGSDGRDGKNLTLDEVKPYLSELAEKFALKFEDLTEEQIGKLRGPKGRDGRNGQDGADGKNFTLDEALPYLEELAGKFALKFEDLTAAQIEAVRGPRGRDGKDGADFSWEKSKENVEALCRELVLASSELLKLKFSDLSQDDIEALRGPRGREGRDGKSFSFEEHKTYFDSLKPKFSDFSDEEKEQLKLRFKDLSDEDKDALKLRFKDLTAEDKDSLRGGRGPRGQRGATGDKGDTVVGPQGPQGLQGPRGLPGPVGMPGVSIQGRDGRDGEDGKDAPYITDIRIEQTKTELEFIFEFSDGTEIRVDGVKLPPGPTNVFVGGGFASNGSGGGGGADPIVETGTFSAPIEIDGNISVPEDGRARIFLIGDSALTPITSIDNGVDTQELYLYGCASGTRIQLTNLSNVKLSGEWQSAEDAQICLHWIESRAAWVEDHRNGIF